MPFPAFDGTIRPHDNVGRFDDAASLAAVSGIPDGPIAEVVGLGFYRHKQGDSTPPDGEIVLAGGNGRWFLEAPFPDTLLAPIMAELQVRDEALSYVIYKLTQAYNDLATKFNGLVDAYNSHGHAALNTVTASTYTLKGSTLIKLNYTVEG
jgi:hypothetical protein